MAVETADVDQLARDRQGARRPHPPQMLGMLAEGRDCCELPDLGTRNVPGTGTPAGICVCEFQEQFGLGQSRTSYHLRVLKDAGLVTEETRGKWTFYELDHETAEASLRALGELVGAPESL